MIEYLAHVDYNPYNTIIVIFQIIPAYPFCQRAGCLTVVRPQPTPTGGFHSSPQPLLVVQGQPSRVGSIFPA